MHNPNPNPNPNLDDEDLITQIHDGSLFKKLKSYADVGYLMGAGTPLILY